MSSIDPMAERAFLRSLRRPPPLALPWISIPKAPEQLDRILSSLDTCICVRRDEAQDFPAEAPFDAEEQKFWDSLVAHITAIRQNAEAK